MNNLTAIVFKTIVHDMILKKKYGSTSNVNMKVRYCRLDFFNEYPFN